MSKPAFGMDALAGSMRSFGLVNGSRCVANRGYEISITVAFSFDF